MEVIHFSREEITRIEFHMTLPIQSGLCEGNLHKFTDGMGLARADDIIVGSILLQHQPHCADIVRSVTPVAAPIEISEIELLLNTMLDVGDGARDLAGDKSLAAARGLVIK